MQNSKSKLKIVFLGTSEFGVIICEGLIKGGYKPVLVVSVPDKPVGRKQIISPPPVKVAAEKFDIPIFQPKIILDLKSEILNLKPHLIIVAAYGQIIPREILDIPKYGCLNVHPSLLPKYRGPAPIQYAILNGDKETGVTIILMDKKMDHGPIAAMSNVKCQMLNATYKELNKKLAHLGAELLVETIPKWIKGEIKQVPQDESKATYTKILKKDDGGVNWQKTAEELERQVRAFDLWPGSYTFWNVMKGKTLRIQILKARVYKSPNEKTYPLGKVLVVPQNEIGIQCGKDFLAIEKLKIEGGKEMAAEEFLRGHLDFIGTILK